MLAFSPDVCRKKYNIWLKDLLTRRRTKEHPKHMLWGSRGSCTYF